MTAAAAWASMLPSTPIQVHAAWLAAEPLRRELLHALEANAAMFVASNSAVVRASFVGSEDVKGG